MDQNDLQAQMRACFERIVRGGGSGSGASRSDAANALMEIRGLIAELGGSGEGVGGNVSNLLSAPAGDREDEDRTAATSRVQAAVERVGRLAAPAARKGLSALFGGGAARKAQQELEEAVQALKRHQETIRNDLVSLGIETASAEAGLQSLQKSLVFLEELSVELISVGALQAGSEPVEQRELRDLLERRHAALATSEMVARQTLAALDLITEGRRRQLENLRQAMSVLPDLTRISGLVNRQ